VVKLSGASVGDEVVLAYVKNCQSPFNLSANAILRLKEAGVTSPVIAAMLTHDSSLRDQNPPAPYAYSQRLYGPGEQPSVGPAPAQPPPQPQLYAPPAGQVPPPPQAEVIPVTPGPDYYWAPGYWGWDGGWIWIGGGWRLRGGIGLGWGWGGWGWPGWGWGGYSGWRGYGRAGFGGYRGGFGGAYRGGGFGGGHGGGGHGGGGHGR
jgi:hypothetical protein